MSERESVEVERELANSVFAWLQSDGDELPPPLNMRAKEILTELQSTPDDLPQIRSIIDEFEEAYQMPLRIYVSGFEEAVVRQLDDEGILEEARSFLHLKLIAAPLDSLESVAQPVAELPTRVEPRNIAASGIARRRPGRPRKAREPLPTVNNLDEPTDGDLAEISNFELEHITEAQVEKLAGTRLDADQVKQYLREIGKYRLLSAEEEVTLAKGIEAGLFARERLDLDDGTLPPEDIRDLEILALIGEEYKSRFINSNLRLVVSIAKKYTGRGMLFLDLIQEGNLGLMRAVEKFNYEKGYKFSTYATWWVRQAVTRAMADQARTIRIPVHMVEVMNKMARVQRQMLQDLGREPTTDELAKELDMSREKVMEVQRYGRNPISLHMPIGDESSTEFGDLIEDTSDEANTAERGINYETLDAINHVLDTLSEREATVIRMRIGLYDGEPKTLDEIGKLYGLTRERIRQIESKTMSKMRHPSRSHMLVGLKQLGIG